MVDLSIGVLHAYHLSGQPHCLLAKRPTFLAHAVTMEIIDHPRAQIESLGEHVAMAG